jgi:uncharacterized protein YndB with AHSA1/START domain
MSKKVAGVISDEYTAVHHTFTIERTYPHAPARVFAAFADQATKRRWFVEGEGWEIFEFTSDFRVGGTEVSRFSFKGGPEVRNDTHYQDIVPNRRMVFTYKMAVGPKPLSVSLATIELLPADGGTRLTYTEQGTFLDGADSAKGREEGCAWLFGRLADELARGA